MVSKATSTWISRKFESEIKPYYCALIHRFATSTPAPNKTIQETTSSAEAGNAAQPSQSAQPTPAPVPDKPKDIRKYAHFTEFAALGILAALFALTYGKLTMQRRVNILSFGLAVAVADESIQILSGRGPMVQDILLDFAGYVAGVLIVGVLAVLTLKKCSTREAIKSS